MVCNSDTLLRRTPCKQICSLKVCTRSLASDTRSDATSPICGKCTCTVELLAAVSYSALPVNELARPRSAVYSKRLELSEQSLFDALQVRLMVSLL